jgi:hypothetical protein
MRPTSSVPIPAVGSSSSRIAGILRERDRELERALAPVGELRREQSALALEADVGEQFERRAASRRLVAEPGSQKRDGRLGLRFERDLDVVEHAQMQEDAVDLKAAHHAQARDLGAAAESP